LFFCFSAQNNADSAGVTGVNERKPKVSNQVNMNQAQVNIRYPFLFNKNNNDKQQNNSSKREKI
jgi:hypothetical protein